MRFYTLTPAMREKERMINKLSKTSRVALRSFCHHNYVMIEDAELGKAYYCLRCCQRVARSV